MKLKDLDIHEIGTTTQIAGAVYYDHKREKFLLLPFPSSRQSLGEDLAGLADILDMDLEEWHDFLRQTDLVEVQGTMVKDRETGKIGKAIIRKTARQVSQNVSWKVYRRDHYRCRYCGTNEVPLTVDHLVLWEEGGPSIEANLVTACKEFNNTRGNTPYHLWLKSKFYAKVSKNLPPAILDANRALVATLDGIPRSPIKGPRKRR